MRVSYSIKVRGYDTVIFWDCTLSDAESICQDVSELLCAECLRNEKGGFGFNGTVHHTLNGLAAYYNINRLAKNLRNANKPGNVEKSLLLMYMCKEYEKALIKSLGDEVFAAFDDGVKTLLIQRVLDDVKSYNVTFGLRTGLRAAKDLVDIGVVGENNQAFSAESFEAAAKELDEFIEIEVEADT